MQLEDYFNFLSSEDIRLKGTRIGIETILYDYLDRGICPEEIAQTYPTLALDQVYATILYYLRNQETITDYMVDWLAHGHKMRAKQRLNPPSIRFRKAAEIDREIEAKVAADGVTDVTDSLAADGVTDVTDKLAANGVTDKLAADRVTDVTDKLAADGERM